MRRAKTPARKLRGAWAAGALAALIGASLWMSAALARSSSLLPYSTADMWPTAVRFLRIDRGAAIREKDPDSGYVLFDLPEGGKSFKGSLELVRATDGEGRESTRVVITLPDLPRHFEGVLLDKLASKAREEYGSPAPGPPRRPPADSGKRGQQPDAGRPTVDLPRAPSGELPRAPVRR
jgi:hypothetical protein